MDSIVEFEPILSGYENHSDVPYNELTHSLLYFAHNIANQNNSLMHTNVQGQEKFYDEYMSEIPIYGLSRSRYENIDSTKDISESEFLDVSSEPVDASVVQAISGSRPTAVVPLEPAQPVQISINRELRSCDDREMMVPASDQSRKRYFCIYCKKLFAKLPRHLEVVHKTEDEIQKLLDSTGKERREILVDLSKKGRFEFNTDPKYNKGFLLTMRRPNPKKLKMAKHYKACFKCRGFYTATNLRHHVKKCTKNALAGERAVLRLSRMVERRVHVKATDILVDRMSKLREDDITRLIKFDWLLITYGNQISMRFTDHFQHDIIRKKLRLAGRILDKVKSICTEVSDFASIYVPKRYDQLVDAIRMVGSFNPTKMHYNAPTTSSDAITLMREIGNLLIAEYIKQDNSEAQRVTENFLKLMNATISNLVSRGVINTKAQMRREHEERIPTTADVKLFFKYIDTQRKLWLSNLNKKFSPPNWRNLLESTMASVIVFNKRRVGEIQNMLVKDFERRKTLQDTLKDLYENLSDEEKEIAKRYSLVEIRGKKNRPVPVLINPGVEKCLKLILRHRKDVGILECNTCLFALPTKIENEIRIVNAGAVLKNSSELCGAKDPESLRGTKIRKHMASIAITMELGDNIVAELCDFMGHQEAVHRKHYRINPMERQVVKISQLLEAATGDYDEDEIESDSINEAHITNNISQNDLTGNPAAQQSPKVPASTGRKRKHGESRNVSKAKPKKRWNQQEKSGVYEAFSSYIKEKTLPSFDVIKSQQRNYESLQSRTPEQIKAWICNQFKLV